jgi:hypothetical protein
MPQRKEVAVLMAAVTARRVAAVALTAAVADPMAAGEAMPAVASVVKLYG